MIKTNIISLINEPNLSDFELEVKQGLTQKRKAIASKYFYDDIGSHLFNKITQHPDYYLTNCELDILSEHKANISKKLQGSNFNLIEFGPGEGIKTNILTQQLIKDDHCFDYIPIDISKEYLCRLSDTLNTNADSEFSIQPIHADYVNGLAWLTKQSDKRNLILFLGSSIGNFKVNEAETFLSALRKALRPKDLILIGFDLVKNFQILKKAYNDSAGLTKAFNLNLLTRINRELEGNFELNNFFHYEYYNAHIGAMESFLVSEKEQSIHIKRINETIQFQAYESIHTEYSHKYSLLDIEQLAKKTGFIILDNYKDTKNYFVDSLWEVNCHS